MIRNLFCSKNKLVRTLLPEAQYISLNNDKPPFCIRRQIKKDIAKHCLHSARFQLWKMALV